MPANGRWDLIRRLKFKPSSNHPSEEKPTPLFAVQLNKLKGLV
jgi:hypothetical protein